MVIIFPVTTFIIIIIIIIIIISSSILDTSAIIVIIVMPQWFDLAPRCLLTFGTSRKGANSKQGACQGQGSFFLFLLLRNSKM